MIIIILGLGLILRLISLNQSLWIDEATSALTTKMSLLDFFNKFSPGDFHPPLYYLTLRIWSLFFGISEIAIRSLSILFGIGTIYIVYLIGKSILNKNAGLITALLLATSGLHVYYSQEARMYSMSTFLVVFSIYLFTRIIQLQQASFFHDKGRVGEWVIFSAIIGLIGLTDYLPLIILPVFWIYAIYTKQKPNWWKKFITSHIILIILALLWSPIFLKQLASGITTTNTSPAWVQVLGTFSLKDILLIPVKFAIGRVSFDNKLLYGSVVLIVLGIFGYLAIKSLKSLKNLKLVYLWLLVPLILALILSIKLPVLNYFRFLFVLPAFYLVIAAGITHTRKFLLVIIILLSLITSFMYLTNPKFQREDWRVAVSYIQNNKSPNSVVIFPANSQMEAYHYYAPSDPIYGPPAIKKGYSQIWLIRYAQAISDPNDSTKQKIESLGYNKVQELDFNGVLVWKYN